MRTTVVLVVAAMAVFGFGVWLGWKGRGDLYTEQVEQCNKDIAEARTHARAQAHDECFAHDKYYMKIGEDRAKREAQKSDLGDVTCSRDSLGVMVCY